MRKSGSFSYISPPAEVLSVTRTGPNGFCKMQPPSTRIVTGQLNNHGYWTGSTLVRSNVVQGNRIDALPYFSEKDELVASGGSMELFKTSSLPQCESSPPIMHTGTMDGMAFLKKVSLASLAHRPISASDKDFVLGIAQTKAKANIRAAMASLPMIWKERQETLRALTKRAGMLADITRRRHNADLAKLKSIRGAKARRRFASEVAESHLEFIFGWAPLMSDMAGLAEFLSKDNLSFRTGSGRMSTGPVQFVNTDVTERIGVNLDGFVPYVKQKAKVTTEYSARCTLRFDITSKLLNDSNLLGFNPLYFAYDTVVLSFVLGWVSNFDKWLQSMDPIIGLQFRTGSNTLRSKTIVEHKITGASSPNGEVTRGECVMTGTRTTTERHVLSSEPDSELFLQNNFGLYQTLATASLVIQRKYKPLKSSLRRSPFKLPRSVKRPAYLPPIAYTPTK